jgi:TAT (twin-arginine translocation) pathway signal sequence
MTHGISRRDFLKIGAATAATGVLIGCLPPRAWVVLEPYVRPRKNNSPVARRGTRARAASVPPAAASSSRSR